LIALLQQTVQNADETIQNVNANILPPFTELLKTTCTTMVNTEVIVVKLENEIETLIHESVHCIKGLDATNRNMNDLVETVELKQIRRGFTHMIKTCFGRKQNPV
jgi:hypothetical protein